MPEPLEPLHLHPAPAGVRRLGQVQYGNAIRDLLGSSIVVPVDVIPKDETYRFANVGSYRGTSGSDVVEGYATAALDVAHQALSVTTKRAAFVGCSPESVDDPCLGVFLANFGRRVLRRPMTPEELDVYRGVLRAGAAAGSVWSGVEYVVAALLQDASFLYMPLVGEPDPARPGGKRYTSHEMASRLSFTLLDSTPDTALLDAALRGDLVTKVGITREVERLLGLPGARGAIARFFSEHLGYYDLEEESKDPATYPRFTPALAHAMRLEMDVVLSDLALDPQRSLGEIFESPRESKIFKDGTPRSGLLTMAGLLTMNSFATRTSPTRRGVFVRERLLGQTVPPPPPNVKTEFKENTTMEHQTVRARLTEHRADPACAGCHGFFDPIGLAFEHYDGIGAYWPTDGNLAIDASGDLDGKPFSDAIGLSQLLETDPRTRLCLVGALAQHVSGNEDIQGLEDFLRQVDADADGGGQVLRKILVALVTNPAFRLIGAAP